MKKLLTALCLFPAIALATETGESCAKIEDSTKRLECYDGVFLKTEQKTNEVKVEKSQWEYEQEKDELRNSITYRADNASLNAVDFGFPYHGSKLYLTLRKDPKYGNDVMFFINGQFNGCMINSCKITVKFDDGKLESYRMVGSDSGSNDTIFIENAKSVKTFVDKLKKSKKLIVEASFYNYGKGQFTFDTQGLEWKHF
ncbi:hypothetical protein [Glaesserella parasuis]|uniref:hypothetical protein n=1 Tax=Glaesserella parasuis TaxID=738 RepID=UPI0008FC743D|nr:hypothetical protein [Glaesserella parasuis]OIT25322.1 hypothetical protein BLL93_03345 [Glaesserella parasuis]